MNTDITACPCGSLRAYLQCCGRLHAGEPSPDAEALMRSRYTAYAMRLGDYLLASWHPDTRPASLEMDEPAGMRPTWLGLSILRHTITGADTAEVEFIARYRIGGASAVRMREHSRFVREDGHWYYRDAL